MDPRRERHKDVSASAPGGQNTRAGGLSESGDDEDEDVLGTVRTAPRVLRTVVEEAALRVPGVARMATTTTSGAEWSRLLGRGAARHGVALAVHGSAVDVDVYLVAEPTANMLEVGSAVQEAVGAAIEHILGMRAQQVNVYIEDVA